MAEELQQTEEMYDMESDCRHGMCVSKLASTLARALELPEEQIYKIAVAGFVHDIGKLLISTYVEEDMDTMKIEKMQYLRLHANLGAEILRKKGYDEDIAQMVLYHHENYDGSGYPFRLRGDQIPLGARIIRVCDVFVALISDRTYRKAFDSDTALFMVIDEVRHFDMHIFLSFQRLINTTDILKELDIILHKDLTSCQTDEA